MIVSIETPVFKGGRLQRCIDSVLYQSSPDWSFSLLWDGGDEQSRRILEALDRRQLPNVTVHFAENRGIARARRFLTEHSHGDFILPLDDDDALPFHAVERFLQIAREKPWASIIRAQRQIIDEDGEVLDTPPWFPFEPRHYQRGMVTDLMNHTQPYLMRRSAYDRTSGWEGFEDFGFAGEDCDIYLKLEEQGAIELLDEPLYYYRVHAKRQSLVLTDEAAFEMWRRLSDKTIERIGLPLRRTTERPPYSYEPLPRDEPALASVDFVRIAAGSSTCSLNEAWRGRTGSFVCVLGADVATEGTRGVQALLHEMHDRGTDLAWPNERLLLVRREVLNATGGFDEGFNDVPLAMVDLLLRAKQRCFECTRGVPLQSSALRSNVHPAELERLRKKWAAYPKLSPEIP